MARKIDFKTRALAVAAFCGAAVAVYYVYNNLKPQKEGMSGFGVLSSIRSQHTVCHKGDYRRTPYCEVAGHIAL